MTSSTTENPIITTVSVRLTPCPLTGDAIGNLPYSILNIVWEGLQEVAKPGEPNGGT